MGYSMLTDTLCDGLLHSNRQFVWVTPCEQSVWVVNLLIMIIKCGLLCKMNNFIKLFHMNNLCGLHEQFMQVTPFEQNV